MACAARTPATDAELALPAGVAAAPVCEAYAAAQCPNRCYICTRLDGFKICVPKNVAEKLAPMVFECAHAHNNVAGAAAEAGPALRSGGVPVPCDTFDANECQVSILAAAERRNALRHAGAKGHPVQARISDTPPPHLVGSLLFPRCCAVPHQRMCAERMCAGDVCAGCPPGFLQRRQRIDSDAPHLTLVFHPLCKLPSLLLMQARCAPLPWSRRAAATHRSRPGSCPRVRVEGLCGQPASLSGKQTGV